MAPCTWSTLSTTSLAITAPLSLAIDPASRTSSPWSIRHAAYSVSQRACSSATAQSAIIHCTPS